MYTFEAVKSRLEKLTGLAQPTAREIKKQIKRSKPRAKRFKDNNLSRTIPRCRSSTIERLFRLGICPIRQPCLSAYSRQMVGSMPGAMAFTITSITTRELMKCSDRPRTRARSFRRQKRRFVAPWPRRCRYPPGRHRARGLKRNKRPSGCRRLSSLRKV